jgi:hypothetical protein
VSDEVRTSNGAIDLPMTVSDVMAEQQAKLGRANAAQTDADRECDGAVHDDWKARGASMPIAKVPLRLTVPNEKNLLYRHMPPVLIFSRRARKPCR